MRFASRDLITVKVSKRIEPNIKRLDDDVEYGVPYYIWVVIRPIKSSISVQMYGEKVSSMRQILTQEPIELGMKVEFEGKHYKIVEADQWTQHWAGIMELE